MLALVGCKTPFSVFLFAMDVKDDLHYDLLTAELIYRINFGCELPGLLRFFAGLPSKEFWSLDDLDYRVGCCEETYEEVRSGLRRYLLAHLNCADLDCFPDAPRLGRGQ